MYKMILIKNALIQNDLIHIDLIQNDLIFHDFSIFMILKKGWRNEETWRKLRVTQDEIVVKNVNNLST